MLLINFFFYKSITTIHISIVNFFDEVAFNLSNSKYKMNNILYENIYIFQGYFCSLQLKNYIQCGPFVLLLLNNVKCI